MNHETIRRVTADLTDHQIEEWHKMAFNVAIEEWHKMAFILTEEKGYCYAYCDDFCRRAVAALAREGWQPIPTAPAQATEGEATELADWLDKHTERLLTLDVNLDVMPSTEIVLFSRIAELLRQQGAAPALADEGAPISLCEPRHSPKPAIPAAPTSERPWERDGWCDAEGRCWFGQPAGGFHGPLPARWKFCKPSEVVQHFPWSLPHWAITIPTTNPAP